MKRSNEASSPAALSRAALAPPAEASSPPAVELFPEGEKPQSRSLLCQRRQRLRQRRRGKSFPLPRRASRLQLPAGAGSSGGSGRREPCLVMPRSSRASDAGRRFGSDYQTGYASDAARSRAMGT
jgi:hypothetical protein